MESSVTNIRAYDKNVLGCQRHKKDVMISFQIENDKDFYDIFLSAEQAEYLLTTLQKSLITNSKKE